MNRESKLTQVQDYLERLCYGVSGRRTGSAGNRMATDWFAARIAEFRFDVECPPFACMDWVHGAASLRCDGSLFDVQVSPYALGCEVEAELAVINTIEELRATDIASTVALLTGDIAREQLMPKSFIFYNPDHHKEIVGLLEKKRPQAIVSATTRDPDLAGGVYPFSLIEDGDFEIPSVYMTAEEGHRLAKMAGCQVSLRSEAQRIPSTGCNVIARKSDGSERKITVFAHIDAKDDTPGALDNGTGVVVLLLLAEMLRDYAGNVELELVALNGEDYYSAPGEMQYWTDYADDFERIMLGINIDAAGYVYGPSAFSTYGCPEGLDATIHSVLSGYGGIIEGEPWYQSDHGLFIQRDRPAMAITSEKFMYLTTHVTHTQKDRPDLVDAAKVVEIAEALSALIVSVVDSTAS